jgi:hypothetical protein
MPAYLPSENNSNSKTPALQTARADDGQQSNRFHTTSSSAASGFSLR